MKRNMPVTFLVALFVLAGLLTTLSLTNASNDRGNAAPSQMLPADLQARDIKDYFLPAEGQAVPISGLPRLA